LRCSPFCLDISHHRRSPSYNPQSHRQFFRSVLDTPKIRQMLACFFRSLLINLPLGINSQWISTIDNKIAGNISCIKKQSDNNISCLRLHHSQTDVPGAESLFFLPDSASAHLADMVHPDDQEMAQSRSGPDLETEATWQAH
jgi:hypothetical protein